MKVYTTADETKDKPLKDIKVLLKENNEKLQEMAQTFNESLYTIEEEKKASMKRQSVTQQGVRLPPIEKQQTSREQRPYTARPMTTATLSSVPSSTALYYLGLII